jgi:8-oxo-dGTP diphosphatase
LDFCYAKNMNKSRTAIQDVMAQIQPVDERERVDLADVNAWVESGAELYRREKPDVPAKHLVAYFAMVDGARKSLLLLDHVKAVVATRWACGGG